MFGLNMRAWLLELAGAVALAFVGISLWVVPTDTPVIGRPPMAFGWLCIIGAALIALLSTVNYVRSFGIELQSPIRRQNLPKVRIEPQPAIPVPVPIRKPAPLSPSKPAPLPMEPGQEQRLFSDATPEALIELAKTPNLTGAQLDNLLAPYKGKWMAVQGDVDDVDTTWPQFLIVPLSRINGNEQVKVQAYFYTDKDRVAALYRGAHIRVLGQIKNADRFGRVYLDQCELTG